MFQLRFPLTISIAGCFGLAFPGHAQPLLVETVIADYQPVILDLKLTGTIEARDSIDLGSRQSGRVVEVLVDQGDRVKAGDPLARLDSVQQDQALDVARASLAAASAAQSQARLASERAAAMLDRGVGTLAARDAAVQALSEADGVVERAESGLDQAQTAVNDTVLRAPNDAVVISRSIAPGQVVGAAQPALRLATLDGLEAVFNAPDHPALVTALGSSVELRTLDFFLPDMRGTVTEVAPLVDPQRGTVTVRARIDGVDADTALLGAAVEGHVNIAMDEGIAVPWTALMRSGDGAAVWTVGDDNRVSMTPVQIGQFVNGSVFLTQGIEAGQVVVGAGSQLLYPGRQIQPAKVLP